MDSSGLCQLHLDIVHSKLRGPSRARTQSILCIHARLQVNQSRAVSMMHRIGLSIFKYAVCHYGMIAER